MLGSDNGMDPESPLFDKSRLCKSVRLESDSGMRGDGSTKGSVSRPGSVRLEGSSRAGRMSVDSLRSRTRSRVMSRWQGRYSITFLKPRRNVSFLNPYFHVYGCKHNHSCSQSEQQEQTVNCFIR